MELWHSTEDAPREPRRPSPGERVAIQIGTWPIEPAQSVRVRYRVCRTDGSIQEDIAPATWTENRGVNSYWRADIGPFGKGDQVSYSVEGTSPAGSTDVVTGSFRVGPRLYLALLWHQHQPLYRDTSKSGRGSFLKPWVRLHALRDYYSMPALVGQFPTVRATFNLTPALLLQVEDYVAHGATDEELELTLVPAERLSGAQRDIILSRFFDADWHNQILCHPRYGELFARRTAAGTFSVSDIRDLQMWANLAWFGEEFRMGSVVLPTGETASVRRFVEKARDFSTADIEEMVVEQMKILRAVVPMHKLLQDQGQIEVSTSPLFHPIIPLLIDTDRATLDRPRTSLPTRFAHPEDADAQVGGAVSLYRRLFGRAPRGMWPPEGAVSSFAVPFFARHGIEWIASDEGVLARSGRFGYDVRNASVLCRPYVASEGDAAATVFFRATHPSDQIGFQLAGERDAEAAAVRLLDGIRTAYARSGNGASGRVLTVALDGENAWGAYREDARPFLRALYGMLARDSEIETVTFSEYLGGNVTRGIDTHSRDSGSSARVYDLFTGSWIDEVGSAPGVDLGTWIGEAEENRAWELLRETREQIATAGVTPASAPRSFDALYAAEGSDWFWWFGDDQDSGSDEEFDDLFRMHLRNALVFAGVKPPPALDLHIVPHAVVWTFADQVASVEPSDRLVVRTNCPGRLHWRIDAEPLRSDELNPVGGVMAGLRRYELRLGPFAAGASHVVRFRFECTHRDCTCSALCCSDEEHIVQVIGGHKQR